jgi:hypothetical protein
VNLRFTAWFSLNSHSKRGVSAPSDERVRCVSRSGRLLARHVYTADEGVSGGCPRYKVTLKKRPQEKWPTGP